MPGEIAEFHQDLKRLADVHWSCEKFRIATGNRIKALEKRGRRDLLIERVYADLTHMEGYLTERLIELIRAHPAWDWARRINGVGEKSFARLVGRIYRYYPGIENLPEKERKACTSRTLNGRCGREDPHYHGIEQYQTGGQLKAHLGLAPGQLRVKGEKINFDPIGKSRCWVLGGNLIKQKGKFYEKFLDYKNSIYSRPGLKIVPTKELPKRGDGKRYEPEGVMSQGHALALALHKMIALFVSCLWEVWRKAEGYPTREPYAIEYLEHTERIDPWEMIDD